MRLQLQIIALVVLSAINTAYAFSEIGAGVSKSTFIHRINNPDEDIDQRNFAYLHAGTRIALYDKTIQFRGSTRRLVLSENGIWGFIKINNYWDEEGLYYFEKNELNTFITRTHDVVVDVSPELSFRLRFSRGEVHKLESEDEDSVTFEVSKQKNVGNLPRSIIPLVTIPRINSAIVDYSATFSSSAANDFQVSIIDGISGIKKRCNTKEVSATKISGNAGGSVGFDLSKFFASLSIKAGVEVSKESEKIEIFEKNENVTRTYFTRSGESGLYKFTRIKGCGSLDKEKFIFTPPDNQEVVLDVNWSKENGLKADSTTGRTLVTCAEQYFSYYDKLFDQGVEERDIPFLISHTGKFKQLDAKCQ